MIRRSLWALGLALSSLLAGDAAGAPQTCPAGATWRGEPPPGGDGYYCAKQDQGGLVRHGWAVLFDRSTGFKSEECEYSDGVRHGRCTLYDSSGARSERGYFARGARAREWWFWSIPSHRDPSRRTRLVPAPGLSPDQLVRRREDLWRHLIDLGAAEADAECLGQAVLEALDDPAAQPRLLCAATLCVGPARGADAPLYVKLGADSAEVERDREVIAATLTRARTASSAEQERAASAAAKAEADAKRRHKEYRAAVVRHEKQVRQWERTSLLCNDGTRSPSCVCGGGHQGCCSWHGGVDGCPREYPTAPTPPPDWTE